MKFITVSDLRLRATQIVRTIEETGEEVIVTKNGIPVVLMRIVDAKEFTLKPQGGKSDGKTKRRV